MIPDVDQYLNSMRKAVAEIILPRLNDDPFAAEQAQLVIATLGLLLDVQDQQYPYAFAEHRAYRNTLESLAEILDGRAGVDAEVSGLKRQTQTQLHREQAVLDGGLPSYRWLRQANDSKKNLLRRLIEALACAPDRSVWQACRGLIDAHIRQQLDRELSWMRLTGFDPGAADLPGIEQRLFGEGQTLP